jgi:hypothetical protein
MAKHKPGSIVQRTAARIYCMRLPVRANHVSSVVMSNMSLHGTRRCILGMVLGTVDVYPILRPHNLPLMKTSAFVDVAISAPPGQPSPTIDTLLATGAGCQKVGECGVYAAALEKVQQQRAAACDNAVRAILRRHRVYQVFKDVRWS